MPKSRRKANILHLVLSRRDLGGLESLPAFSARPKQAYGTKRERICVSFLDGGQSELASLAGDFGPIDTSIPY